MCFVRDLLKKMDASTRLPECAKDHATSPDAKVSQWYKPNGELRVRCGQRRFYARCHLREKGKWKYPSWVLTAKPSMEGTKRWSAANVQGRSQKVSLGPFNKGRRQFQGFSGQWVEKFL